MTISQGSMTDTWMTSYQRYLANGLLPSELVEAKAIKTNLGKYTLIDGKLICHGCAHPTLICISGDQCTQVMVEFHEGICGSHVGGRALVLKVIRAGYYWPTTKENRGRYAQRCEKYLVVTISPSGLKLSPLPKSPPTRYNILYGST